jgi:hypothetical protein
MTQFLLTLDGFINLDFIETIVERNGNWLAIDKEDHPHKVSSLLMDSEEFAERLGTTVVPAAPGFWALSSVCWPEQDEPPPYFREPIIAWKVGEYNVTPVTIDSWSTAAILYPDGQVYDQTDGTKFKSEADWLEAVRARERK